MLPIARRVLAAVLACLLALQQVGATSPGCTIGGLLTGRGVCCCAEPADAPAPSCCSAAASPAKPDGVSVESGKKSCACGVDAPAPTNALPLQPGVRGEHGDAHALAHWIDQGAQTSACTPILSTASPPEPSPLIPGTPTPGIARRDRGLLAVTCVARC